MFLKNVIEVSFVYKFLLYSEVIQLCICIYVYICIFFSIFFSFVVYHRILNVVLRAIQ